MDNIGRTLLRPSNQRTSRLNYSWLPWRPAQLHYIRLFISRAVFYKKLETKIWPIFPLREDIIISSQGGLFLLKCAWVLTFPRRSNNVVGIKMWFHPQQELLVLLLMTGTLWQPRLVWHSSHFPLIRHLTRGLLALSSLRILLASATQVGKKLHSGLYLLFSHTCPSVRIHFGDNSKKCAVNVRTSKRQF